MDSSVTERRRVEADSCNSDSSDRQSAAKSRTAPDVSPDALAPFIAFGASLAASHGLAAATELAESESAALGLLIEVTHDLRSPISSMMVLIEQLRSGQAGPLSRQQQSQLGLLYEATLEVSNLTQNALQLARRQLARNRAALNEKPQAASFSVAELWQSVRALVAPIAQERGLTLRWSGPEADWRTGQPDAIQRILLNLVTNALKYTARGSISVTAHELDSGRVRFRVQDTGSGLSEAARALIGELPTSPSLTQASTTSNLGLAICATMLRSMGSKLELPDSGSSGTCVEFELDLPIATQ